MTFPLHGVIPIKKASGGDVLSLSMGACKFLMSLISVWNSQITAISLAAEIWEKTECKFHIKIDQLSVGINPGLRSFTTALTRLTTLILRVGHASYDWVHFYKESGQKYLLYRIDLFIRTSVYTSRQNSKYLETITQHFVRKKHNFYYTVSQFDWEMILKEGNNEGKSTHFRTSEVRGACAHHSLSLCLI